MKTLLIAICFILSSVSLCDPVWADTSVSEMYPGSWLLTGKQLNLLQESSEQNYGGKLRITLVDHPCLAKMEAAMRAMDDVIRQLDDGDRPLVIPGDAKSWDLWQLAKRDCWTRLP